MILSERQFEQMIGRLKSSPAARESLVSLLDEGHPVYAQRDAGTVARMRGWILLALGEVGVTDYELACVLEELDTGRGPYVVAAAATGK